MLKGKLKRLFARFFDLLLIFVPLFILSKSILPSSWTVVEILFCISSILWIPFETLFITLFGTTPGKALFGIKVRDQKGLKLCFAKSFKRSGSAWIRALGCGIPLFALVTSIIFLVKKSAPKWTEGNQIIISNRKFITGIAIALTLLLAYSPVYFLDKGYHNASFQTEELGSHENWISFEAKEQNFTISFPKEPEKIEKKLPIPKSNNHLDYVEYQSKHSLENVTLSVSHTILPQSWLKWSSGLLLKGTLKVLISQVKAHFVGNSSNKIQGHPSLDYLHYKDIANENGEMQRMETAGALVLKQNKLYKVEITYPEHLKDECQKELSYFISSFSLT